MKKALKLTFSLLLLLCMVGNTLGVAYAADDGVLVAWMMEPSGGSMVTYLGFVGNGISPLKTDGLIEDTIGNNTKGIDGTAAATFRSVSYQVTHPMMLVDTRTAGDGVPQVKAGHTYFKSVMMRLNGEDYNGKEQEQTKQITTFREKGGAGFLTKAEDFAAKLATYDSGKDTITDGYNWFIDPVKGLSYTLTTDWQRVTEAVYRDTTNETVGADRAGWSVLARSDWSSNVWTGNYEIVVDDYILLEVPNDDLLKTVYPRVHGAKIESSGKQAGDKLTASAEFYDVNPMAEPAISYQWQSSENEQTWTDIAGATSAAYTLTEADADPATAKSFRVAATVTSANSGGQKVSKTAYSQPFAVAGDAVLTAVELSSTTPFVGQSLSAKPSVIREDKVTGYAYQWQRSDSGSDYTDIGGATGESYETTAEDKGKFIRAGVSITTAEGTSEMVYSQGVKVYGADDEFTFYVDGKSDGIGTLESPFSTLEQARDAVRNARKGGMENPVTVYLRGGEYYRDTQFVLDANDKNITFAAYPGEEVQITGGKHVDQQYIKKVTDENILNRLVEKNARNHLYQVDLSAYYDEIPAVKDWSSGLCGWDETPFTDQVRIVVNGSATDIARWPNATEQELITTSISGSKGQRTTVTYTDPTNRASKWSPEAFDHLMIKGHMAYHWTYNMQYINDFDVEKQKFTTKNPTGENWQKDEAFYFYNLLDEIDMPGESFMDAENKILYFYGYGDMENPDVIAPISTARFISIVRSQNITFRDIDFGYTRGNVVEAYGHNGLTFDGCDWKHFMKRNYMYGENGLLTNCYLYGGAVTMLVWQDFNKGNSIEYAVDGVSANNAAVNNRFNLGNVLQFYDAPGMTCRMSNGMVVRNNEFYNSPHDAMAVGVSADMLVEKNYIHDNVQWTGDMGAVYWNLNSSALGNEFRYNLFENNGSSYGDGWSQSIFWDDIASGPWVHHNIFNRGTLPTSEGGTRYPLKGYGGNFATVENNVFIDVPYGAQFQDYYPNNEKKQTGWWLSVFGKAADGMNGATYTEENWKGVKALISDPKNVERYKGTPWEKFFDHVNIDIYNKEGMANLDRNQDKDALMKLAEKYAPTEQNWFTNNVLVGSLSNKIGLDPTYHNGVETNSFFADMSEADSLFTDYDGGDFSLSAAGLAKVKSQISEFENIDTSDIGPQPFERDGKTQTVGGGRPVISNPSIRLSGDYASIDYKFTDPDGDREGRHQVTWYVADKADGAYKKLGAGNMHSLPISEVAGKYIKYEIIPYDATGLDGEKVLSQAVLAEGGSGADKTVLWDTIDEAEVLLNSAIAGDDEGQYPQAAIDTLEKAVEAARTAANTSGMSQSEVNAAVITLQEAVSVFQNAQVSLLDYQSLKPLLADTANWKTVTGDDPTFADGSMTVPDGSWVSYVGSKYKNKMFNFRMKLEKESDADELSGAVLFRVGDPDSRIWENQNTGYLLWLKDSILEYQVWRGTSSDKKEFKNDFIRLDTEHELAVGVYDIADNKVKYLVYIDGVKVYEAEDEALYGGEGYLCFTINGAKMTISPVEVDTGKLEVQIQEAGKLRSEAVIGNGYGQYPSAAGLDAAIAAANAALTDDNARQKDIDLAESALRSAVVVFKATITDNEDVTNDKTIAINYNIPTAAFRVSSGVSLRLQADPSREQPKVNTETATNAGKILMEIPSGTTLTASGWNGSFQTPLYGTTPSKTINNAAISGVYKIGADTVINASRAVRILLPGQAGKTVVYLEDGKYVTVRDTLSADNQATADKELAGGGVKKITSGNDLVIWTTKLCELVTYTRANEPNPTDPPIPVPTLPNYGGGSSSGGNGSGSMLGLGNNQTPSATGRFKDTIGHWAQSDIEAMAARGIVTGVTADTFEPERAITRAEFATLIVKALNLSSNASTGFSDVAKDGWYYTYVNAAANVGIISGYDGLFRPDDRITREEMAVILCKAYAFLEKSAGRGEIDRFSDKDTISAWAYDYVDEATTAGLISGMTADTFAPAENTTRAQAASVIRRLLEK